MTKDIAKPKNRTPKAQIAKGEKNAFPAGETEAEQKANLSAMIRASGTSDPDIAHTLINQLIAVLPGKGFGNQQDFVNSALGLLSGLAPKGELQAMLAIQMISVHFLAMNTAQKVTQGGQHPLMVSELVARTNKLMRTFNLQIESMQKLQGKTKKVTVEHVTIQGGQNIVGDVDIHHGGKTDGKN